jgi:DNA-binding response OmpR family regulator
MTTRPPRAPTKGDGKRPKVRGATQADKADKPDKPDKPDKRRPPSIVPTEQYERIADDAVVEETELPEVPQLRVLVFESAPHLASGQAAIAAAGHAVVAAASGRESIERLRAMIGDADALLVGLPGGELLIDAARVHGPVRPVVIAACTSGALDAARRAAAAGADLVAVRPHDVERLAPILFAAARLVEQRRQVVAAQRPAADPHDGQAELAEREPGALQPVEVFQRAAELELERVRRYAYPLAVAMFSVDIATEPPPGVRGILRARAGNALVNAIRDVDLVTELEQDRFLVLLPYTDRLIGAEVARRIISAVAAGDPVIAGGRTFSPKVIGAVAGARPGAPVSFPELLRDVTQLLEQAAVTGAALAVEP